MKTDTSLPSPASPPKVQTVSGQSPGELKRIPLANISESTTNPRTNFEPGPLAELAESLKQQGILMPLLVRPRLSSTAKNKNEENVSKALGIGEERFELVDGARRFRAAQSIRLDSAPCIVRAMTDAEAREIQLLSFVRENISDLEAARSYQDLIAHHGYTAEKLREKLGLAKATFYGRMSILKGSPKVLKALADGEITQSHVQIIVTVPDVKDQEELLEGCLDMGQSVKDLKSEIEDRFVASLDKAKFDVAATYKDAIIPAPCADCEWRGANAKDKFPALGLRPNACLKPECFKSKLRASQMASAAERVKEGAELLTPEQSAKVFMNEYNHSPSGGYSNLTDWARTNKGTKQFTELLGKDAKKLKKVLAWHPNGELYEIYRDADLWAAVAPKGIKPAEDSSYAAKPPKNETPEAKAKRVAAEKAAKEKEEFDKKVELTARGRIAEAVLVAVAKNPADVLRHDVLRHTHTIGRLAELRTRYNLPKGGKELDAAITKMEMAKLAPLLWEIDMRDYQGGWQEYTTSQFAQAMEVDVKAIRKQVAEELKAAAKKPEQPKGPDIIAKAKAGKGKVKK